MSATRLAQAALVLVAACECHSSTSRDAGTALDSGLDSGMDTGADARVADAARDASLPGTACSREDCTQERPYCCRDYFDEFSPRSCYGQPSTEDVEATGVDCYELVAEPAPLVMDCTADRACPVESPWCCSRWGAETWCSTRPLFGWSCIDRDGVAAYPTNPYDRSSIRRCAEGDACPPERRYCCNDLFCAVESAHGWTCEAE